jgi:hypothetical protein
MINDLQPVQADMTIIGELPWRTSQTLEFPASYGARQVPQRQQEAFQAWGWGLCRFLKRRIL